MFLCFGIIQAHSQALDIVNSTGDTLVHVKNDGNVSIGETSLSFLLEMGSGTHVTVGDIWTNASSREYKETSTT